MNTAKLEKLFAEYEKAFARLDYTGMAENYPSHFISAGPKGSISQNRDEFIEKAGSAAAFYKNLGQHDAHIISKDIIYISNEYCLVTVHWGVKFAKTGDELVVFDVSYLVQEINDDMKIILFISHEDEEAAMRNLGLATSAETT